MHPRKSRQKSPSTSSVDSGLGHSIRKRLTDKSAMNREVNYSQQLLQAASLTAKTQLLKRGLMNSNKKVQGFINKISPVKTPESVSDFEYITTSSQFLPLACSSQQVKKSESTSESSGEDDKLTTERTIRVKRNSSTDSEAELSTVNEVNISNKPTSKSNTVSRKKSMINILDDQLILSDSREEVDSDSKSVVAIHKSISSYSVSSEFNSEEEEQEKELLSKNKIRNNESLNTIKAHHTASVSKSTPRDESKDSDSSNSEKNHCHSVIPKSKNSEDRSNKKSIALPNIIYEKSKVRTCNTDISVKTFQKQVKSVSPKKNLKSSLQLKDISSTESESGEKQSSDESDLDGTSESKQKVKSVSQKKNLKSSLQLKDISSTESESSEKQSPDESDLDGPIESKSKHKVLDKTTVLLKNFLSENEDYKTLSIPQKADLRDIDSEDEIYLLQIPKSINPKVMEGVSFSLIKKSKLKMESGKYSIKRQSTNSSLLTYSNSFKIIKPLATLKMEKNLKVKENDEIVVEERKMQPLPNNIKVRHPLFGSDYKSKIQLEVQIKEKLEQALQRFQIKRKTPKRKKRVGNEEDKNHLISKLLEEKFGNLSRSTTKNKHIESSSPNRTLELSGVKTEFFHGKKEIIDNAKNKEKIDIPFEVKGFENSNDLESIVKTEVMDSLYLPNMLDNGSHPKKKKKKKHFPETQELINQVESPAVHFNKIKKERDEVEETLIKQEIKSESKNRNKGEKNKNIYDDISIDEQLISHFSEKSLNRKKERKRSHEKTEALDNKPEIDLMMEKNEQNTMNRIKYSEYVDIPVKKKKRKQIELEYTNTELPIKKEPSEEYPIQSQKKRRKSVLSSTRIFENLDTSDFKVDVSEIESEESVVKRKDSSNQIHDDTVNNDLINSLLFSVKNRLESKSDKKKLSKRKTS